MKTPILRCQWWTVPEGPSIFIGIGAAKAGSTWLANYLWGHDEVFLSPTKGLRYFDRKYGGLAWYSKLRAKPLKAIFRYSLERPAVGFRLLVNHMLLLCGRDPAYTRFLLAGGAGRKAVGEISVTYCRLTKDVFREIDALVPDARFIFMIRNPADIIWSYARFLIKKGNVRSAGETLARPRFIDRQLRRTDFGRTIRDLTDVVGPDRLLVVFYENLFSNAGEAQCRRICDFIGVSYRVPELEQRFNISPKHQLDDEKRRQLVMLSEATYKYIAAHFPDSYPESWKADHAYFAG